MALSIPEAVCCFLKASLGKENTYKPLSSTTRDHREVKEQRAGDEFRRTPPPSLQGVCSSLPAQNQVTLNFSVLMHSCLEDPRDRGVCWAAVYGVAQSRTRLK